MSGPTIDVVLGARSYPVVVAAGGIDRAGALFAPYARDGRLVVVTDSNVFAAQGARFAAALEGAGLSPDGIVVPPGEASKDWSHLSRLVDDLLARGVERGDTVVAFGGGIVGDLAGFAAAVTKRGIGLVQVPTTLLAMVDSSVGGKTGINTAAGKNLAGAFHQPSLVLIDPSCLATLPERELRSGYAEVVKYGLIGDPAFFGWCELHGAALLAGDESARIHAIRTCVAAKAAIVAADERETAGRRALLNLGHSFAHALEAESGFTLLHGEAVAIGLSLAFRLSAQLGLCPADDAARVTAHLASVGLPTHPGQVGVTADGHHLAERIRRDKKAVGGRIRLVLADGIGRAFVSGDVDEATLAAFLDDP